MKYRAVLFDFDYTLGDATESIFTAFTHALTTMGYPAPQREEVRKTIGMVVTDAYTQMTGDSSAEGQQRFFDLFHPVARDMQAQGIVDLCPGARELLEALKEAGAVTALVSTKNTDSLEGIIESKGLHGLIGCVVGGGSVATHKPDPEGLLYALKVLGAAPGETLYCGDTTIDAQTAQNAGVEFSAVLNGTTSGEAFEAYPHVHIAPDLWDLKAWLGL